MPAPGSRARSALLRAVFFSLPFTYLLKLRGAEGHSPVRFDGYFRIGFRGCADALAPVAHCERVKTRQLYGLTRC